jgi:colanic acid biosynthesis glycosyl transferase WcaI
MRPAARDNALRSKWGLAPEQQVVLYSGNIGRKQGLSYLLQAAELMQGEDSVKFVIVGDGAGRAELEQMARSAGLHSVIFKPLQLRERLADLLNLADVHVVCQLRGAADIVLPSKLTGILSVGGHCVVTADEDTELGRLAAEHPGAIERVEPESAEALAAGIRTLLPRRAAGCNRAARKYAETCLDREAVLGRFNRELVEFVARP